MNAWQEPGMASLFLSCFGLSVLSALVPWFNGEVILLAHAVALRSPVDLLALATVAASGQMGGKCALYWLGAQSGRLAASRDGRVGRWTRLLGNRGARAAAIVFVSSVVGIPPLYLTTVAAGAVRMAFPRFFAAAGIGRVIRFGALVFCPQLAMRLVGIG